MTPERQVKLPVARVQDLGDGAYIINDVELWLAPIGELEPHRYAIEST